MVKEETVWKMTYSSSFEYMYKLQKYAAVSSIEKKKSHTKYCTSEIYISFSFYQINNSLNLKKSVNFSNKVILLKLKPVAMEDNKKNIQKSAYLEVFLNNFTF